MKHNWTKAQEKRIVSLRDKGATWKDIQRESGLSLASLRNKYRRLKGIIPVLILTIIISSCTDAEMAKIGGLGDEFKVEILNCDGSITHSWISSGKVSTEQKSDGYFFKDKATGKLIEVSGNVIITKQ